MNWELIPFDIVFFYMRKKFIIALEGSMYVPTRVYSPFNFV